MSYKRVLLKLSGEALQGENGIINYDYIKEIGGVVKTAVSEGSQIAIVCGAGNIWRGRQSCAEMDRVRADQMGMLATVINCLAIQDAFAAAGVESVVMTASEMHSFGEYFTKRDAVAALEAGKVVIFAGGTGCPYFSTDTTAVLRAAEIEAEVIMMAKSIDGVYTADPKKDPTAVRLDETTYDYILSNKLGVIDMAAASLATDCNLPLYLFGLDKAENILKVIRGEKLGTIVKV